MKTVDLAFDVLVVVIAIVAHYCGLMDVRVFATLVPLVLEWCKMRYIFRSINSVKQTSVVRVLALDAIKFAVVVAMLFVLVSPANKENMEYSILYCATFVAAQMLGSILYITARK